MATSLISHSFVLADLFDVESMSYPVPDHVLEDELGLEWVVCPTCGGEGWIEGSPSVWTGHPTAAPCCRCHRMGEVLDFPLENSLEPILRLAA